MDRKTYLAKLVEAGITVRTVWSAKSETKPKYDDVFCYTVHGPDGKYLTNIVVKEHIMDAGVSVYIASPTDSVSEEIEFLLKGGFVE